MRPVVALSLLASLLAACGEPRDCLNTCDKLFGTQAEQCNIQVPGRTQDEMMGSCMEQCNYAIARSGELGDYNPNERSGGNEDVTITNDQQAAAWMDCIAETACQDLQANYCAPTTNF